MLAADFGHTDIVELMCSWPDAPHKEPRETEVEDEEVVEGALCQTLGPCKRDVAAALAVARAKGMRDVEELLVSYL